MAAYALRGSGVIRLDDEAYIPPVANNRDWQAYLGWLADGNIPDSDPALDPVTERAAAKDRIDIAREAAIAAGVSYGNHPYQTDPDSIRNVTAVLTLVNAGVPLPSGFTWRTTDNVDVPFTSADVVGLAATIQQAGWAAYQLSWALKAQIDAAVTVEQIDAIAWP